MSMGAVLYSAGNTNGSDLGGLYRSMPKKATMMASSHLARLQLATSWPTGSAVFWIAVILGFFLIADVIH